MHNLHQISILCTPVALFKSGCISSEDIEVWSSKLMWLWEAKCVLEIRPREGDIGVLFILELPDQSHLHVGIGRDGIDVCTLWRGDQCVMWNNFIGFCSMWNPLQTDADYEFDSSSRKLIRRNCFLMGAPVEASTEERRQWLRWLAHSVDTRKQNSAQDS